MSDLRLLFDVNHPAHVHNLRHLIAAFRGEGHTVRVAARDKDVTLQLLDHYGIPYRVLTAVGRGRLGQLRELVLREMRLLWEALQFRPHAIVGSSAHAARVALLTGARSILLNEDDLPVIRSYARLAYPLATAVLTPDCLAHERHGRRHVTYPSYHELIYLHPQRFTPDRRALEELGVGREPYAIVRLSALAAHHDRGVLGIDDTLLGRVATLVNGSVRLLISSERPLPPQLEHFRLAIPPARLHDALAGAEFFVGDSQTMTVEAAVLGTPAFQLSGLAGRLSVPNQLRDYGLCFLFRPCQEQEMLRELSAVLSWPDRKVEFQSRRRRLLAEKIDPLPWLLERLRAILTE